MLAMPINMASWFARHDCLKLFQCTSPSSRGSGSKLSALGSTQPEGQHNLGVNTTWGQQKAFRHGRFKHDVCILNSTITHVKCALHASQHSRLQPVVYSLLFTACCDAYFVSAVPAGP